MPLSTLRHALAGRRRMTRGRRGPLPLRRGALPSPPPCRFIPALSTKISFINAMAEVCEATGADVIALSKALSYDDRIGGRFLHAGLGFGGGCLPKDIRAFMARAGELGVDQALSFLKEVDAINMRRRARMVDLAAELVGGSFGGMKVAVLGAAFKPNSDDIRDSPALDVAATIQRRGGRGGGLRPDGHGAGPSEVPAAGLPRLRTGGGQGCRPGAAPDRVAGVSRGRPDGARRGGCRAPHRGWT